MPPCAPNPPRPLVLASTSRYRRELLARLRVPFDVVAAPVDETPRPGETPQAAARRLALAKAAAGAALRPDAVVIGSDQTATIDGTAIVGKPGDHAAALAQLRAASGRTLWFHTAVAVADASQPQPAIDVVSTRVAFRTLTEREIDDYLRAEQPYDCAGAAKAEGLGIALLETIDGPDPTALIGLPLIRLSAMLRAAGYRIPG
ncbi:MAG TPA: Maf family nucleotide pyrophosphatase [Burkholderiaceae bacterium]|nr:Maf family nucleotide pyrophosphatase [Burkholderiaceae bacterium]